MAILAIDTALDHCQAAAFDSVGAVIATSGGPAKGNAEAIVHHAADVLTAAGWDCVERVAVTTGPGSFTGVRVGLAYAQGIAAPRDWPVVGISTLAVLAADVDGPALAITDARHGNVYAALFGMPDAPPPARLTLTDAQSLAIQNSATVVAYGPAPLLDGARTVDQLELRHLARLAASLDPAANPPQALYLADPDAAPQRHKALARR
ncbi:MAG: tRNA (adenosine(37)-N6)-threonylcarbamoyltransferase complex dimerization subunit type 1 TsaB [Pseudomonadota bacterium]